MKRYLARLSVCLVVLSSLSTWTIAEDGSPLAWSGFYVGGQFGASNLAGTLESLDYCQGAGQCVSDFSASQILAGVVAGYDLVTGNLVIGGELSASAKFGEAGSLLQGFDSYQGDWMTSSPWEASALARVGVLVTPDFLAFVSGGATIAGFDLANANCPQCAEWEDVNLHGDTRVGWTLGVGGELAINDNWHVRAQYLHSDFGDYHAEGASEGYEYSSRITSDAVKGGIVFRVR